MDNGWSYQTHVAIENGILLVVVFVVVFGLSRLVLHLVGVS